MTRAELFLGIPVTDLVVEHLSSIDPSLLEMFIGQNGDYLQKVSYNGGLYLGKFAGDISDLGALELLQTNIRSFLNKLLPISISQEIPLELFPLAVPN